MTPRALAAITVRIIGAWLLIEALCGLGAILFYHQELAGTAGIHRRWYNGEPQLMMGIHDTYDVILHFAPEIFGIGLRIIFGLILIFTSKPIARLLSRNLENF